MEMFFVMALTGVLSLTWGLLELEKRYRQNEAQRSIRAYKRQQAKIAKALGR